MRKRVSAVRDVLSARKNRALNPTTYVSAVAYKNIGRLAQPAPSSREILAGPPPSRPWASGKPQIFVTEITERRHRGHGGRGVTCPAVVCGGGSLTRRVSESVALVCQVAAIVPLATRCQGGRDDRRYRATRASRSRRLACVFRLSLRTRPRLCRSPRFARAAAKKSPRSRRNQDAL